MLKIKAIFISLVVLVSCSSVATTKKESDALLEFASANCLFWYFKANEISTKDIQTISGGIVEKSRYSADKFQQVALLVKGYTPKIKTKHEVDLHLARCFMLREDHEFLKEIKKISDSY